jgi:meso-butanediol dehydrogenase/(S,S)-butanediol dehydrogenase/diacetyl reductase
MGSAFGLIGYPKMPTYCATKGAVINLTRQLALDYAEHHVRVNAICPGPVLTGRLQGFIDSGQLIPEENLRGVPMARFSDPQEIASVVVFLASDEATYMTGSIVSVDGGMTVH